MRQPTPPFAAPPDTLTASPHRTAGGPHLTPTTAPTASTNIPQPHPAAHAATPATAEATSPGAPGSTATAPRPTSHGIAPPARPTAPRQPVDLPAVHTSLIGVALPGLAISQDGQLTGRRLDGIYRAGRRLLSRCQVRVAGREPLTVQARTTGADRLARSVSVVIRCRP